MTVDLHAFLPTAQFGAVKEITPITTGLSGSSVYAVTTATGEYVLRRHGGDRSVWDNALAVQQLAAAQGIAPRVVHFDDDAQVTVSAKVLGVSFGVAAAQTAAQAALFGSLVAILAKLHALPTTGRPVRDAVGLTRAAWMEQVQRPGFPPWAVPLGERLRAIAGLMAVDPRLVLSHGDLNPANILWDGTQVWLVDWEGSGASHPYLDLATIANFLNLPDNAALGLLAAQERTPLNMTQTQVFAACRDLVRLAYGAVFLRLVPDLTAVQLASRDETPSLVQCYGMMAKGTLIMSEPQGQALFGAALLKQCC